MQYRRSVQGRMLLTELETSALTESKRMTNHNTPQLSRMGLPVHCAAVPGLSRLNTRAVQPCSLLKFSKCSEGTSCLYVQGGRIDQARNRHGTGRKFCSLSNIPFFYGFITYYCGTKFCEFPSCFFDKSECVESKTRLLDSALDVR
jgi:hypothetical protein